MARQVSYLTIMPTREQQECGDGADQRGEHIGLGIPGIALGAEKLVGPLAKGQGRPPLDELIEGTDRQHDAEDDEGQHPSAPHISPADEDLPGDECRDQTLEEMADLVVGVPRQTEQVGDLEAKGHPGIGVGAAEHEHQGVEKDKAIQQVGERKTLVGRQQDGEGDEYGADLHHPGCPVVGLETGKEQQPEEQYQGKEKRFGAVRGHQVPRLGVVGRFRALVPNPVKEKQAR